jgi:hypothetical protein
MKSSKPGTAGGATGEQRRKVAYKKAAPGEVRRSAEKVKRRFAAAIENLKNR